MSIIAVCGAAGSGKTTFLRLLSGLGPIVLEQSSNTSIFPLSFTELRSEDVTKLIKDSEIPGFSNPFSGAIVMYDITDKGSFQEATLLATHLSGLIKNTGSIAWPVFVFGTHCDAVNGRKVTIQEAETLCHTSGFFYMEVGSDGTNVDLARRLIEIKMRFAEKKKQIFSNRQRQGQQTHEREEQQEEEHVEEEVKETTPPPPRPKKQKKRKRRKKKAKKTKQEDQELQELLKRVERYNSPPEEISEREFDLNVATSPEASPTQESREDTVYSLHESLAAPSSERVMTLLEREEPAFYLTIPYRQETQGCGGDMFITQCDRGDHVRSLQMGIRMSDDVWELARQICIALRAASARPVCVQCGPGEECVGSLARYIQNKLLEWRDTL